MKTRMKDASKARSIHSGAEKRGTQKVSQTKPAANSKKQRAKPATSKQNRVVDMLRQTQGTSIAAIMKATGWQQHSVRGFFAGTVRKKLGLTLVSEVVSGERVYRIADRKPAKAGPPKSKRAA